MRSNWGINSESKWTESSMFCYRRGCNCEGCYIKDVLETHCFMKKAVLALVKKYGAPSNNEDTLSINQQKIVFAILAGAKTKKEISEKTNIAEGLIQHNLNELYTIAETDGVIYPKKRNRLKTLIKWIKGEYYAL